MDFCKYKSEAPILWMIILDLANNIDKLADNPPVSSYRNDQEELSRIHNERGEHKFGLLRPRVRFHLRVRRDNQHDARR